MSSVLLVALASASSDAFRSLLQLPHPHQHVSSAGEYERQYRGHADAPAPLQGRIGAGQSLLEATQAGERLGEIAQRGHGQLDFLDRVEDRHRLFRRLRRLLEPPEPNLYQAQHAERRAVQARETERLGLTAGLLAQLQRPFQLPQTVVRLSQPGPAFRLTVYVPHQMGQVDSFVQPGDRVAQLAEAPLPHGGVHQRAECECIGYLSSPERVAGRYPGRSGAVGVLGWWP